VLLGAVERVAGDEFVGKGAICLAALGGSVVLEDRKRDVWSHLHTVIARDACLKHKVPKILTGVGFDLLAQPIAAVIHRNHYAFDS
jgi:hypothetical protein